MSRPTEKEAYIMRVRRLIKKIYQENLNREKKELTYIDYDSKYAIKVCRGEKCIIITKLMFDNYFVETNKENKKELENRIERALEEV